MPVVGMASGGRCHSSKQACPFRLIQGSVHARAGLWLVTSIAMVKPIYLGLTPHYSIGWETLPRRTLLLSTVPLRLDG